MSRTPPRPRLPRHPAASCPACSALCPARAGVGGRPDRLLLAAGPRLLLAGGPARLLAWRRGRREGRQQLHLHPAAPGVVAKAEANAVLVVGGSHLGALHVHDAGVREHLAVKTLPRLLLPEALHTRGGRDDVSPYQLHQRVLPALVLDPGVRAALQEEVHDQRGSQMRSPVEGGAAVDRAARVDIDAAVDQKAAHRDVSRLARDDKR
mmetsp:Transcript_78993/g.170679  ORF Transcript_78993/g.170679 Transcript_78993/m.170679 type:complete len:208 (-) Transcript_78993:544-1167(-)